MYFPTGSLVALSLLAGAASAAPTPIKGRSIVRRGTNHTIYKPTAFSSASTYKTTSNYNALKKIKSKGSVNARSAAYAKRSTSSGDSTLISLIEGEEFATEITIGSDTFDVIVDTGSSDTWVVEKGFTCIDLDTGRETTESDCEFGSTWSPDSNFKEISGEEFDIEYGDGEYLFGVMGTESITLAGITVDSQTMGLVTSAAWEGDGTTSGLTGLAYPSLTSAYSEQTDEQVEYNGIITSMWKDGLIDSYFSLAIERDVSGDAGYLALGGLPPVSYTGDFATTPILVTNIEGYPDTYDFYTINIDSMTLNGETLSGAGGDSVQYIVDSGTTLNYVPTSIAEEINAAFSPAATYSEDEGAWIVDCDATAPTHGVTIGGTTFYINALDMILEAGTDENGEAICISGIVDGGSDTSEDLYILGDTFQKNVLTVFDIGAVELKFAAREDYTSNDTY
ncbi:acid protease [Aspergillus heteromorphus CBS 117.55]|uniref:Acid protease n=1 Tax=Aspergillus heteromorphus CBS 117.55 TaxID=1448321 RepID=A0A317W7P1_9EURO|nr:acid protease [Aspergillus heteromorphus CBS 117.55]PWY82099.1 acid protease [Aspergillus heteromorphus CBS 117.55]